MKIVCISASQIPSLTANSIQAMKACQALAQLGHSVHLLAPGAGSVPWEQLAAHYGLESQFAVEWLPAHPSLKRYDFSWRAVRRAVKLQADLAYIWPLQAAVMSLLAGLPVAVELHGEPEGRFGPAVFRLFLKLRGRKLLLPITRALLERLESAYRYRFDPGEVVIVPNGVDLERFQNLPEPGEARRLLGLPEVFTAGYTGHLYPGRGMGLLVELARRFPQVQFLWVGGRPAEVDEWQGRLAAEDLNNVLLTGFVENSRLPLYQAAADVLLMPYERYIEGSSGGNSVDICSPMKMFEYMASGRAILSSDLPVIREVLNEENALLPPPENETAWAEALNKLLADQALAKRLGCQAQQDANRYTWLSRAEKALAGF